MSGWEYYFQQVCEAVGVAPHEGQIYYLDCPQCGKGQKHFSFSSRWAHCFRCGYKPSFKQLLADLGHDKPIVVEHVPIRKRRWWQGQANELALGFTATPGLVSTWQNYKPLPEEVISAYRLGLGVFPNLWFRDDPGRQPDFVDPDGGAHWKCEHPRLIIPLYVAGAVVGFRCRAISCSCPRWLSPGGSRLVLFNGGRLGSPNLDPTLGDAPLSPPQTRVLLIVENPIDALLVEHYWHHWAVATLGVSIWKPNWTKLLLGLEIESVVAYDNDAPGNTTDPEILRRWKANYPKVPPPLNGRKLVRKLNLSGQRSHLYRWPFGLERGTDIGDLFMDKKTRKTSATEQLAFWFIQHILEREILPEDYRGMHKKHAMLLLKDYSVAEICGCLDAMKDGLFGDLKVTYMTMVNTFEPPLMSQFRDYLTVPPPIYLETEYAQWEERRSRNYAQIETGE